MTVVLFLLAMLCGVCLAQEWGLQDGALFGRMDPKEQRVFTDAIANGHRVRFLMRTMDRTNFSLFAHVAKDARIDPNPDFQPKIFEANGMLLSKMFEMEVSGLRWKDRAAILQDSEANETVRRVLGCDGFIGWAILQRFVFRFNWDAGRVDMLDRIPTPVQKWDKWQLSEGEAKETLVARVRIGEQDQLKVGIDTGQPGGVILDEKLFHRIVGKADASRTLDFVVRPDSRTAQVAQVAFVSELQIGSNVIRGVIVQSRRGLKQQFGLDAVIKLNALSRFDFVMVGRVRAVYAKPRPRYFWPNHYSRLGAAFVPEKPGPDLSGRWRAHVMPGSCADRAGLRNGDVLLGALRVDCPKPIRLNVATHAIQPAGSKLRLLLDRDGKDIELEVTLEEIFPDAKMYDPVPKEPKKP